MIVASNGERSSSPRASWNYPGSPDCAKRCSVFCPLGTRKAGETPALPGQCPDTALLAGGCRLILAKNSLDCKIAHNRDWPERMGTGLICVCHSLGHLVSEITSHEDFVFSTGGLFKSGRHEQRTNRQQRSTSREFNSETAERHKFCSKVNPS